MMEMLQIAFRNIFRNKRRSMLNGIALSLGMIIMLAAFGWVRGYFTTLYTGMMRFDTGQAQILHKDYLEEKRRMPLDLMVENYHELRETVQALPDIQHASGRIDFRLELGSGRNYMPMLGRGIDPTYERYITTIDDHITEGRYLRANEEGVLLGKNAADRLGVSVGDTVYLRIRDRYSAPNTAAYPIVGLFRLGYPLMDQNYVFTDISRTGDLLRTENQASRLVLWFADGISPEAGTAVLTKELDDLNGQLRVYPWQRFAQTMIAAVKADSGAFFALLVILFLLIFLGILNSMSMAVQERGQEIGTMLAIGMKKRQLAWLLTAESLLLGVFSFVFAAVIGGSLAAYVQFVGFDLSQFMPPDLPIPFGERFYGDYRLIDFFISGILGIGTALLGSIIPVRRAVKVEIVETMRMGHV